MAGWREGAGKARARARRSSSANTYAGVPKRSASSIASQPPSRGGRARPGGSRAGRRGRGLSGSPSGAIIAGGAPMPTGEPRRVRAAAAIGGCVCHDQLVTPARSTFGKDRGLQARMMLTLFLLGLVYAVLIVCSSPSAAQGHHDRRWSRGACSSCRCSPRTSSRSHPWGCARSRRARTPSSTRSWNGCACRPTCPSRAWPDQADEHAERVRDGPLRRSRRRLSRRPRHPAAAFARRSSKG